MNDSVIRQAGARLRELWLTWVAAGMLPVPVLMMVSASESGVVACCYLGVASAWLATEIFGGGGLPESRRAWCARMLAIVGALAANVGLFVVLGLSVDVASGIPFPLLAALSACPAVGLVPWLMSRVRERYAVLILGAVIVGATKLAGCVAARVVYGPTFGAEGYIAGDWQTAKLMISSFWALNVVMAVGLPVAGYLRLKRRGESI